MDLSWFDRAVWVVGFAGHIILLFVLVGKERWRTFPIFTSLIAFNTLRTILLFLIYRYGSEVVYSRAYWSIEVLDIGLQLGLVFEMARIVLKPTGTWVRDAWKLFSLFGAVGTCIAAVLAFVAVPATVTGLNAWSTRAQLFPTMLFCVLFASVMVASSSLGLVWRNHVMGLGRGLTIWAIVSLMGGVCSYFGPNWHINLLDHIRITTYIGATVYWIITFWYPEPKSRTLTPEMYAYLSSLHK
jgi:hypothetical protein